MTKKHVFLISILFLFLTGIYSLDDSNIEKKFVIYNITKELKNVIINKVSGQKDFTEQINGQVNQIFENFIGILTEIPLVKVYERNNLQKILQEQKLSVSDEFDEQTAIEAGKLVGANMLIITNIIVTDIDSDGDAFYTLNIKIISIKTGQIIKMIKINNADFSFNLKSAVKQISNLKIN